MKALKFIIFAHSYDENIGGTIALHRLCHLLNERGENAVLFPFFYNYLCIRDDIEEGGFQLSDVELKLIKGGFVVNEHFNTPVIESIKNLGKWDDYVVIYPEVVFGNPLGAKNVVRWLLHNPGFHTGQIKYGHGELYFRYNDRFERYVQEGSKTSEYLLTVLHLFTQYYNLNGVSENRQGFAYCLRKGRNRKIVHDLSQGICIDGMNHKEVSDTFKKVKRFISYDLHTGYSFYAALCGCESVVVPEEGVSISDWVSDKASRDGIAYGESEEQLEHARSTAHLRYEQLMKVQQESEQSVAVCVQEIKDFFQLEQQ